MSLYAIRGKLSGRLLHEDSPHFSKYIFPDDYDGAKAHLEKYGMEDTHEIVILRVEPVEYCKGV